MALRPTNKGFKCQSLKFTHMNNLSHGSSILFATDDWFAEAENLLKDTDPEWKEGVFTSEGKWMDGWETRRKRIPGHDFCIIKLEYPSVIFGVDCDTSFFTGNYTPCVSIQAGRLPEADEALIPSRKGVRGQGATKEDMKRVGRVHSEKWKTLIAKTRLGAGYSDTCHNYMAVDNRELWTHIRLNYYPDGGVARLRIFGRVQRSLSNIMTTSPLNVDNYINLIAMKIGGYCIGLSDAHYGHPRNLILDGKTHNIGDGWETARKLQRPNSLSVDDNGNLELYGFEWAAFRLGVPGSVCRIDVDTTAFKGNAPYACKVECCRLNCSLKNEAKKECDIQMENENPDESQVAGIAAGFHQSTKNNPWTTLLSITTLKPDTNHEFDVNQLESVGPVTHVRVTIYPDGGLAKLRIWGVPASDAF